MAANRLELDADEMLGLIQEAATRIVDWITGLDDRPVDTSAGVAPDFVRDLVEPLPESSSGLRETLDFLFEVGATSGLNPISPGFMGYVPGGGLFHAAVADLIGSAINQYVAVGAVAPVLNQIEANAVRWLCEILGYPATARGFLTSGGSTANQSAITTARAVRLGESFQDSVIYVSDQVHHCVTKAAILAGFPGSSIRVLPTDDSFRLNPSVVAGAIETDRRSGRRPFMVVGSAGTVNTGAVDPLGDLADLAAVENLWFHVDGAYGGLFRLTDRGRETLSGIERADSVVVDPHKTLFLPYGTGALLVREGRHLVETYRSAADYLPSHDGDDGDVWDFCDLSPELTRPFRGLRVWLPLKLHGAGVFREYLDEKLDLAAWVHERLSSNPHLQMLAPPDFSILAFAVAEDGSGLDERNEKSRQLLKRVNARNRVHLTGTMLNGVFAIRVAIVAYRTHRERVEMLVEDVVACLRELVQTGSRSGLSAND